MTHENDTRKTINPSGMCECGCGEPAPLAARTNSCWGHVKGQPIRFISGHQSRPQKTVSESPNPSGLCMCGCGGITPIAGYSSVRVGWVKGEHNRYIKGHNNRSSPVEYVEEYRGYETPCWIWQRSIQPDGYGRCVVKTDGKRRSTGAHQMMWEREYGPIPKGLEIDHLCRVRSCVNPAHLEIVTRSQNQRRRLDRILTAELVAEMRTLRESGWTLIRLSERFHVSVPVVSKICRYEYWI